MVEVGRRSGGRQQEPPATSPSPPPKAYSEIVAGDSDVYAKWSQALGSAEDLTYLSTRDAMERSLYRAG